MNSHAIVPVIAIVVYVPLFVILLANRPWNNRQRLFLLFLIPAVLWSSIDFLFRSDFFISEKLLLVKVGICCLFWMLVQFHYFVSSRRFYPERPGT